MGTSRDDAVGIFRAALDRAGPETLLRESVRLDEKAIRVMGERINVDTGGRIYVFGSGKASAGMAVSLENILGDLIEGGLVVSTRCPGVVSRIRCVEGSHPRPTSKSLQAAEALLSWLSLPGADDLFFYLLSGGSSSLVEKPVPPVSIDELNEVTDLLLRGGVSIGDMNVVRKHISLIKGGRLALSTRAKGVVLVLSDVIGDDLSTIGSGPFYPDDSTYVDAFRILRDAGLWDAMPGSVQRVIMDGMDGLLEETPKEPRAGVTHHIVGSNRTALEGARAEALKRGYEARIVTEGLSGEARKVAREMVREAREYGRREPGKPLCLIYGGETTVTVKGNGKGGRNQEMCLAALSELDESDNIVFLSCGTDGVDGNTDAAGAVVDRGTLERAGAIGLHPEAYLNNNDSYNFFKKTGDLVKTGPTGTNVMDVAVLLIRP